MASEIEQDEEQKRQQLRQRPHRAWVGWWQDGVPRCAYCGCPVAFDRRKTWHVGDSDGR